MCLSMLVQMDITKGLLTPMTMRSTVEVHDVNINTVIVMSASEKGTRSKVPIFILQKVQEVMELYRLVSIQ